MTDLVKRLRRMGKGKHPFGILSDEAADRIEQLESANAECERQYQEWVRKCTETESANAELEAKIEAVRNCDRYSYFGVGEVCDPDPNKPEWYHEDDVTAALDG